MGESFDWETRLALVVGLAVAAAVVGFGVLRTNWGGPMAQSAQVEDEAARRGGAAGFRKTNQANPGPSMRRLPKQRVDELRRQQRIELMRQRANRPGPTPLPLRRAEPQRDERTKDPAR